MGSWVKKTAKDLIDKGYVVVPAAYIENNLTPLVPFKDITEPTPIKNDKWNDADLIGIVLGDTVFLDYDGNHATDKGEKAIPVKEISEKIGFDLEGHHIQSNDIGDSLHWLFKAKKPFNAKKHVQHNHSRFINFVDIKTNNQLMYVKKGKTLNIPPIDQLPTVPKKLLKALKRTTNEKNGIGKTGGTSKGVRVLPNDIRDIKKALKLIDPNCSGEVWRKIIWALAYNFSFNEDGRQIAEDFSRGKMWKGKEKIDFDESVLEATYFKNENAEVPNPAKIDTIFYFAGKGRKEQGRCDSAPEIKTKKKSKAATPRKEEGRTLAIPEHIMTCGGLIELGMEALTQDGMVDIDQYNLPVVLTTIANAVSGRLGFDGIRPNLYNIKVGTTSTGKSTSDGIIKKQLKSVGFYGATGFASGAGLLRSLASINGSGGNPRCLISIDEATTIFKIHGGDDSLAAGKREALLELYTSTGTTLNKVYADMKNNIVVENPVVSLIANATTGIFGDIVPEDFETGILQRFEFWVYEGKVPMRTRPSMKKNKALISFCKKIEKIHKVISFTHLQADREAMDLLNAFSVRVTNLQNTKGLEASKSGIISREYDLAKKYAIIHYASRLGCKIGKKNKLSADDMQFGIDVAVMLGKWKIRCLYDSVSVGDWADKKKLFVDAIGACTRSKLKATRANMEKKRKLIGNWRERDFQEIVDTLVDMNEVEEKTNARGVACWEII